jgi:transcriptional regulator with XRE-family HTH domain
MPDGNMPVKHSYSWQDVALAIAREDNARMENLREIRKTKGMSQEQLAEAADVSQGTISKIERGEMNVTYDVIIKIATALDVQPVQLFPLSELQRRTLNAIEAIDPARRDAALVVLEAMASPHR